MGSGRLFQTNHIGSRIWQGLEAGESIQALVSELSSEFQIPYEDVMQDSVRFIESLTRENFVT